KKAIADAAAAEGGEVVRWWGGEVVKEEYASTTPPSHHPTTSPPRMAFPEAFEREVASLHKAMSAEVPIFLVRRLLLDVGGYSEQRLSERYGDRIRSQVQAARQRLAAAGCPVPAVEARTRYRWIREALAGCVVRPEHRPVSWTDRLDQVLTHRVCG